MIIYIDRRQYVVSTESEEQVARQIFQWRATLRAVWGEGREQRQWVRHSLRELRRLRTAFFEARMLGLALACVQRTEGLVATARWGLV